MASKRRQRRVVCGDKRAYPDQTQAVRALVGLERQGVILASYRCRFCRQWHLGHCRRARGED